VTIGVRVLPAAGDAVVRRVETVRVGSGSRVVRAEMVVMVVGIRVAMVRRVGSGSRVVRVVMTAGGRVGSGSRVVRIAMTAGVHVVMARVVRVVEMLGRVGSGSRAERVVMSGAVRAVMIAGGRVVRVHDVMVARRVVTIAVRTFHKLRPSVVAPRCLRERVRASTGRTNRLAIAPSVKSASSMKAPFGAASSIPTNVLVETAPGASRALMAGKMGRCFQHHLHYRNPWRAKFDARSVTAATSS
jgi:hypothetical protein